MAGMKVRQVGAAAVQACRVAGVIRQAVTWADYLRAGCFQLRQPVATRLATSAHSITAPIRTACLLAVRLVDARNNQPAVLPFSFVYTRSRNLDASIIGSRTVLQPRQVLQFGKLDLGTCNVQVEVSRLQAQGRVCWRFVNRGH